MNTQILKTTHLFALVVFVLLGIVVAASTRSHTSQQNQNGNQNSSQQNKNSAQPRNENQVSNENGNMNSNTKANQNTGTAAEGSRVAASTISSGDRKFMTSAAMSGRKEVELSRLAAERATDPAVKQFAQTMVEAHTKANEELMQLAANKGVTLPTTRDAKLQATLTRLQSLSGSDFDRAYLKEAGVSAHEKSVKLFEEESQSGTDADTRAFAAKLLPTIQEHLKMAREVSGTKDEPVNSNTNARPNP